MTRTHTTSLNNNTKLTQQLTLAANPSVYPGDNQEHRATTRHARKVTLTANLKALLYRQRLSLLSL